MATATRSKPRARKAQRKAAPPAECRNLVIVSDIHSGCRLGLCPPDGAALDDGGRYEPSKFQLWMWDKWTEFWNDFVPYSCRGEPFWVVFNGDAIDGVHHQSTTQISHNIEDQTEIAYRILKPVVDLCEGRYYHVRGTEAHVGKSGVEEERLAKRLNAIPNELGQYARYELWKRVGPKLVHCLHHIGTTSSAGYEATAVHKEMVEMLSESATWHDEPPDAIVRSHRHRYFRTEIPGGRRDGGETHERFAIVTPAWQGKTPFAWKIAGARRSQPQFGGVVIRYSDDGEFFCRRKIWTLERSRVE